MTENINKLKRKYQHSERDVELNDYGDELQERKKLKAMINNVEILPLCDWTRNIAIEKYIKQEEQKKKKLKVSPIWDQFTVDNLGANGAASIDKNNTTDPSKSISGKEKLNELIEALNKMDDIGFKRSNGQRKMHKAYIGACLKKIYGEDIYRDLSELLREYELEELINHVIVTTPRRFGKTFGTGQFIAALLCVIAGIEIAIYSTGRRASRKMLILIHKIVVRLMGTESCIKSFSEEKLEVQGKYGVSVCYSYPSKTQI